MVFLLTLCTTSGESSTVSTGCLYENTSLKFSDCISNETRGNSFNDIIGAFFHSKTVVTGDNVLSKLESICSDEAFIRKYAYCAQISMENCPQLSSAIINYVSKDVAVFCEDGKPSNWLSTIMQQSDYLYDQRCIDYDYGVLEVIQHCVDEADFLSDITNLIVSYAASSIQSSILRWFLCTVKKATLFPDDDGDGVLNCGSTWQDVIVMLAMRVSAFNQLGSTINQSVINGLKAIKTGQ